MLTTLAATVAFIPVTVCSGFLAAWFTDLQGFRRRSLVERFLWSVPLSIAVSTIASVLIGRFFSFTAAAVLILLSLPGTIALLAFEHTQLRRTGKKWLIGLRPHGATVLGLALVFIAILILSVVDFQSGQKLYLSLTFYDIASRTNWANSILRTGIPPANPHYFYLHPASLRYYYFWLVDCAVVARISHLPMRSIINAGCIWSGFALTSLSGLYLKHFLLAGNRLRRQFLLVASLPAVGGLSVCIYFWNMLVLHVAPPGEVWSPGQIADFLSFFLFYPHHLVSMICCLFALLLASSSASNNTRARLTGIVFIGFALASAFGLSVYVTFAFFLLMLCWAIWQSAFKKNWHAPLTLFAGGLVALLLLLPYLHEITHAESQMYGGAPFALSVREMIPPDRLVHSPLLRTLAVAHPAAARELAKLILLPFGFSLELGFYFLILIFFLLPLWRRRGQIPPAHSTLIFIVLCAFPITAFIRSAVLDVNDFGIHSALFIQFPLLLVASEVLIASKPDQSHAALQSHDSFSLPLAPAIRSLLTLTLLIGIFGTAWQAVVLRFLLPIADISAGRASNPHVAALPHKAWLSYFGYSELNKLIPADAVVQFNPADDWFFWKNTDLANINRQTAIASGGFSGCGSSTGGDPAGCPIMSSAILPLFNRATAGQARSVCAAFRIHYLVATIYDPAWKDPASWVWTLNPVLSDPEFRALDCSPQPGQP
jgi:hypothetical protein